MPGSPLCVYCRQWPSAPDYRPFCSARCQMADLGKWLAGEYRVEGRAADDPEGGVLATGAEDLEQDGHIARRRRRSL